ncbi:hypothetical protein [Acidovorax cavernicola]|uniref:Uncharacterized protein n=1 Tax=Acidovorax cavernicola TaxID=1675792 RepID=A0A9X8D4D0_9BURK|nr:hypothetical protein [Acidovorax cavernicola]RIX79111.1 hypothetical protein D3H34_15335 [Acidovorax cavernicola]
MASVDLVFRAAPLAQPAHLVFGDDGSNPITDAVISGAITLAKPTLSGRVALGIGVSGAVVLTKPTLSGEVVYRSDTQRPLVGRTRARFQDALPMAVGTQDRAQRAARLPVATEARFQSAVPLRVGVRARWADTQRMRRASRDRFQEGMPLGTSAVARFQDSQRLPLARAVRFQNGAPLGTSAVVRFQDGQKIRNQARTRYQDAIALHAAFAEHDGYGRPIEVGSRTRYQDAIRPVPGLGDTPIPPRPEPCYVPTGNLVFSALWSADTNLVFICERHLPPEPGGTVVVPVRRIYTVINTASLRRVVGNVLIPNTAMSLTIDADSWTWGFTARVPGEALSDLEPVGGVPVELEATINGVAYRAIVEGISRDRTFGRSDLTITGRGRAAVLDAPYSPVMTFGNIADRTVQQLAADVLTFNGVSLGWDIDAGWKPEDWLVPAGVFSHQGSYMSAINAIAADAGAYVQAHRSDKALSVLKRYPAKPWEWGDVVPDYELPSDVVQKEAVVWTEKPNYNRVFVRGMKSGRLGQITRQGTAGDIEAPMVTAQLGTNAIGTRQRGLAVLADTGRQAAVSLRLPVLAETGIIPPGKFVRYVDGATTRIGLVRSVAAEVERADKKLTIWQTIGVETHV